MYLSNLKEEKEKAPEVKMFLSCCYHSKIKADFSQSRPLPTNQLWEASNSNLISKEKFQKMT